MDSIDQNVPRARTEGLSVQELAGETLVYDLDRHKVHSLNRTASAVWRMCDGHTDIRAMAERLETELSAPVTAAVVTMAVDQLADAQLLDSAAGASRPSGISRRDLIKRAGIAAAVALPVVTSIVAPRATEAASCLPPESGCSTGSQCCSGICSGGTCV